MDNVLKSYRHRIPNVDKAVLWISLVGLEDSCW